MSLVSITVRVLLVEDNDGDARLIQELLKGETSPGVTFEITRVTDLSGAVQQLGRGRFNVIVLDLWLPDSTGVQTVRALRAHCSDIPLVVVTGNADQHVGVDALNAGAQDFFVKGHVDSPLLAKALLRQARRARGQDFAKPPSLAAVRVLLVEDNPGDARLLHELLSHEPIPGITFDLTRVTRLSDALGRIAETSFDVILLDLWLPDSGGVETVARVRARSDETPIIVITGDTGEHVSIEALRAGAQDFLLKGTLDPELLTRRLLRQVNQEELA